MELEHDRINNYLKRIDPKQCPLCGAQRWTLTSKTFQAIEYAGKNLYAGNSAFPVVPLSCTNCGFTYFINAFLSGLIDKPIDEKNQTADKSQTSEGNQ